MASPLFCPSQTFPFLRNDTKTWRPLNSSCWIQEWLFHKSENVFGKIMIAWAPYVTCTVNWHGGILKPKLGKQCPPNLIVLTDWKTKNFGTKSWKSMMSSWKRHIVTRKKIKQYLICTMKIEMRCACGGGADKKRERDHFMTKKSWNTSTWIPLTSIMGRFLIIRVIKDHNADGYQNYCQGAGTDFFLCRSSDYHTILLAIVHEQIVQRHIIGLWNMKQSHIASFFII